MPRQYTNNRTPRRRSLRSWPVRWRGVITRDVGTDCLFAESADMAKAQFKQQYPMREIMSVGKPVTMKPIK